MLETTDGAPARCLESRESSRTNVFVSAALYHDGECSSATIRNLSEFGALVEAPVLPSPGTQVRLSRGALCVAGTVVWRRGGKAGLRFESAVTVAEWLPTRLGRGQARIDEMVRQVRIGAAPKVDHISQAAVSPTLAAPQELESIASSIEKIAEALSGDPLVVAQHGWKLQQLEVIIQQLRRVARAV